MNADFFNEDELESVRGLTAVPALASTARDVVRWVLHNIPRDRRSVVLGRNIGARALKATPFKFLLKSKHDVLTVEPPKVVMVDFLSHYAIPRRNSGDQAACAAEIEVDALSPAEAGERILALLVLKNSRQEKQ